MFHALRTLAMTSALLLVPIACKESRGDSHYVPAAPAMPNTWKVKADQTYNHNQKEWLETEGRLEGRLAALRVTTYEVNGKNVQLNTLVPKSTDEGDKIFRILANKKKPWSYLRKGEIVYEFVGPEQAEKDIVAARDLLAR